MTRAVNNKEAISPEREHETHPGTVIIQLTRLLLCKGRISNVRTTLVLRAIPVAAIPDPVKTPPVVITAAPPTPPRKPAVPDMPIVENAAPRPAPITGASSPADNPITSPPPGRPTGEWKPVE